MDNAHSDHAHHIVTPATYVKVLAALMVLMVLTIAAAELPLGDPAAVLLALLIATVKMALIILYFMHVKYSSQLTWLFVGSTLFFLLILFVLTLCDYFTRAWHSPFTDPPYLG